MTIVSVAPFVPFDGIAHAGGEYYLRHVKALLRLGYSVEVIAPDTSENRDACPPSGVRVTLLPGAPGPVARVLTALNVRVRHARPPFGFVRGASKSSEGRNVLRGAAVFEVQWTQMAGAVSALRRHAPQGTPVVCVAHDVILQSLERQAAMPGIGAGKRWVRRLRAALGAHDERLALQSVDHVLTFSRKDQDLLRERVGIASVSVIHPSLEPEGTRAPATDPRQTNIALFVGAFNRPENADAAEWLLEDIWPEVLRQHPAARLILAGIGPSERMKEFAGRSESVQITGYVDDLSPYYEGASAALVPLRLGAGVKFKAITAMFFGVPLVSTTVGAEGIAADGLFAAVTDDPREFASATAAVLADGAATAAIGAAARAFAQETYGNQRFDEELGSLYAAFRGSGSDPLRVNRADET